MANKNRDIIAAHIMAAIAKEELRTNVSEAMDVVMMARAAVKATDALLAELHPPKPVPEAKTWSLEHDEDGAMFYAAKVGKFKMSLHRNNSRGKGHLKGCMWDLYVEDTTDRNARVEQLSVVGNTKQAQNEAINMVFRMFQEDG